jgi:hypothetical protein
LAHLGEADRSVKHKRRRHSAGSALPSNGADFAQAHNRPIFARHPSPRSWVFALTGSHNRRAVRLGESRRQYDAGSCATPRFWRNFLSCHTKLAARVVRKSGWCEPNTSLPARAPFVSSTAGAASINGQSWMHR